MVKYIIVLFCLAATVFSCQKHHNFDYEAMERELHTNPRELLVKLDTLLTTRLDKQTRADATLSLPLFRKSGFISEAGQHAAGTD